MKKFLVIIMIITMVLSATGCTSNKGDTVEPIKIGLITNLSGASTAWGTSEHNALKMEIKKINEAGGVLGRPIELIPYDFKSDQLEAVNATKRLVSDGAVGIIGPSASGAGIAMATVTESEGIPFIATVATNPKVTVDENTGKVRRTAFRVCLIDPFQGTVAAKFVTDDLGAKTFATIYDVGSDYSQGLEQYFIEAMEGFGGTMTAREGFRTGEVDFRAILGKLKEINPDVIYIPTDMTQAAMIAKQAKDLGIESILFSCDSASTPDFINLAGDGAEGVYMTSIANIEDPAIKEWVAEYIAEYGKDPVLPNPVMATDAIRAYVYAIEQANSTEPDKIIEQLGNIKDLQVLSGNLTIDPDTHNPVNKPCIVEMVKDGKVQFVKRVENAE